MLLCKIVFDYSVNCDISSFMVQEKINSKQRLIETANLLIWKNSFGSVSVDEICRQSGVQKGSFYHYFPSKIDLALAVMDECFEEMRPVLDNVFSVSNEPVERLRNAADLIIKYQEDAYKTCGSVVGCAFASLGSEMATQDERIRQRIQMKFELLERYYISTLRDLIEQGALPEDTDVRAKASDIYSYVTGQLLMARINNSLEFLKSDLKKGMLRIAGVEIKALENA